LLRSFSARAAAHRSHDSRPALHHLCRAGAGDRAMTPACRTPGCNRTPRPDSPWCADCFVRVVWGRPGPPVTVTRAGVRPLPEITESELRLLDGNR